MQSRLGLFFAGGLVGVGLLVAGQFITRQQSPLESTGTEAPEFPAAHEPLVSGRVDLSGVLALPTEFARRQALYGLAAQSDGDRLRSLIADASQISDRRDREVALAVFFRRFCDLDPRAALTLANSDPHARTERYRNVVWQTWARNDLADAIFAVNTIPRHDDQVAAVQNLYAAYGYMGNESTDRIFSETGIEHNRQTRLRYLRVLLRDSPVHVINFINTEPSRLRRDEYISWFAYALDVSDPDAAYSYVEAFETSGDKSLYKTTIDSRFSRLNPVDTVWRALAKDETGPDSEFHNAIEELASQDVDAAIELFGQIESSNAKVLAAFVIATELANTNPRRALAWLRTLEDTRTDKIEESLLAVIAMTDPDFALETALALPRARRESAISGMLLRTAMSSPEQAVSLLESIPDDVDLSRSLRMFGSVWLTRNPSAAIGWLDSLDVDEAAHIAEFSVRTAMRTQPDTAIRLLSYLDDEKAASSGRFIVSELAATGDVGWAMSVMEELKGREIAGLEPSLAGGIASHDHQLAMQFVQQLPDQETRDAAVAEVARMVVRSDAADAGTVLPTLINSIQDARVRSRASRTVMLQLMRSDKKRARQLLEELRLDDNEKDIYRRSMLDKDN